jgi:hypothetical protein
MRFRKIYPYGRKGIMLARRQQWRLELLFMWNRWTDCRRIAVGDIAVQAMLWVNGPLGRVVAMLHARTRFQLNAS